MRKTIYIAEWMQQAAVIDPEELTEQDIVDAYEADNIFACWIHGGKQIPIEQYWDVDRIHDRNASLT